MVNQREGNEARSARPLLAPAFIVKPGAEEVGLIFITYLKPSLWLRSSCTCSFSPSLWPRSITRVMSPGCVGLCSPNHREPARPVPGTETTSPLLSGSCPVRRPNSLLKNQKCSHKTCFSCGTGCSCHVGQSVKLAFMGDLGDGCELAVPRTAVLPRGAASCPRRCVLGEVPSRGVRCVWKGAITLTQ